MDIQLLSHTQDPQKVIYAAAKQCYSKKDGAQIFKAAGAETPQAVGAFIKELMARGHLSTVEHVTFTFAITGVSRVCTHQLVRHRVASYSQQSQRYVDMESFEYVIPPMIAKDPELKKRFEQTVDSIRASYAEMKTLVTAQKNLDKEAVNQDMRFILPQAVTTKIVLTMNCRELLHFFAERLCTRAQWEIRAVAQKMHDLCRETLPEVFAGSGAKCVQYSFCPEGEKGCGRYPAKGKK